MPGMGERAYAYAKACGIIGKSFTGRRLESLGRASRLSELDRLVFPSSSRDLPEKELLADLEERLIKRSVHDSIAVARSFRKPPEFLSLLIRAYEYADIKSALSALSAAGSAGPGNAEKPFFTDLGCFGTVNFAAWPDFPAMIRGTEFEFLLNKNGELDREKSVITVQTELDCRYYQSLWKALRKLPRKDRRVSEHILSEEISLRNAVCVLRLRTYYRMKAEEIRSHLIDIAVTIQGKSLSLAADAGACLEFPLDSRREWDGWKRAEFLNPGGGEWKADPRYFQNAASRYLYRLARRSFRVNPFSLDTVFCYIKIKQFEEDVLTSSAEGLGLGMTSHDVFAMLGAES